MLSRAAELFDERVGDTLKVVLPNGAVLAAVNGLELKAWAELALIVLSICYTIWRWRRDSFVVCQACRDGRPPAACPVAAHKRPTWCPKKL